MPITPVIANSDRRGAAALLEEVDPRRHARPEDPTAARSAASSLETAPARPTELLATWRLVITTPGATSEAVPTHS